MTSSLVPRTIPLLILVKAMTQMMRTLFACLCCLAGFGHAAEPLNVLFIASDDLRPDLGCYGHPLVKSPNIDRLAQRGLVFDRAYCQQAVCSPSRSSLMTGLRPDTTKVWDLETHFRKALPDVVTLSQLFKNHGYFTQGLGKIYHGVLNDAPSWSTPPQTPGADEDAPPAKKRAGGRKPAKGPATPAQAAAPRTDIPVTKTDRGPAFSATEEAPNAGGEGALADDAIAALRQRKSAAQPFFLAVGFHKPHLPFHSPKTYWDLYDPAQITLAPNNSLPKGAPLFALADKNELWSYSGVPNVSTLPDDYARQLRHGYYAAISYMDAQLGRVLDELDHLGLRESTLIVLWGDHGWKLGEHSRWSKHSTVENDARAPLIIAAPGMKTAGQHTQSLVEFVDIYPTLAELAGLPMPANLEGTSLRPVLADPSARVKTATFSQYPRTTVGRKMIGYSMRTERYRFTRWVDRQDPNHLYATELYDHQTDPGENTNIATDPAQQTLIEQLTAQAIAGWKGALRPTEKKPTEAPASLPLK
jgi:iduronate 2-sulfatase